MCYCEKTHVDENDSIDCLVAERDSLLLQVGKNQKDAAEVKRMLLEHAYDPQSAVMHFLDRIITEKPGRNNPLHLIDTWKRYAAFLGKEVENLAGFAHIHGWRCSDEVYETGKKFRAELGIPERSQSPEVKDP